MSRIAGLYGSGSLAEACASVAAMQQAQRTQSDWAMHAQPVGRGVLGWCGPRAENIAAKGGVVAAIDGCIYNRHEFETSENDASLLLALYERHGFVDALRRLNGDFAIGLHDSRTGAIWLARDRFGVKPLYYSTHGERLACASRPRALLTLPWVSPEPNREFVALFAASHYRTFDNNPDRSAYRDIAQVQAGHALCMRDGSLTKACYWTLEPLPDFTDPEADLAHEYRHLLLDAVSMRIRQARRPAFTLSGGMDSSSVLACAAKQTDEKQHAVSCVYTDKTYDESADIQSMLGTAVSEWHPVNIGTPDVIPIVEEMVSLHDEPVATSTWLSHYLLCQYVRAQGFDSLFGGLGGDELNAGEYEYYFFFFADLYSAGRLDLLKAETAQWIENHDHSIFRKDVDVMWDGLKRLVDLSQPGRCLPDRRRLGRYHGALARDYWNLENFEPVMDQPFQSYLKNRTFQDLSRETIPCCLRAEDRHTVAVGLDHYDPFLDHRLAEFMFRVPATSQIRHGVSKHLLRQAMCGILPEETRTRIKKTGWNAPAHVWFSGSGRELLMDLIGSRAFRERGVYDVRCVERLVDEHEQIVSSQAPVENHMMFLWQLVNLELWLRAIGT